MQTSHKLNYPPNRLRGLKHTPKLNDDNVDYIRLNYRRGSKTHGMRPLAKRFGVSEVTVHSIIHERSHVPKEWGDRPRCKEPTSIRWRERQSDHHDGFDRDELQRLCDQLQAELLEEMGLI